MGCQNRGSGSGTCEGEEVRVGHVKIEEAGNRTCGSRKLYSGTFGKRGNGSGT